MCNVISSTVDPKPHKVRIRWGTDWDPKGTTTYEFATDDELHAFLMGLSEAEGMDDWNQINPNADGTWPDDEDSDDEEEKVEPTQWTNCYAHCGKVWTDKHSCQCNDECPVCHGEIEPFMSIDQDGDIQVHVSDDFVPEGGWPTGIHHSLTDLKALALETANG